jgi:cobalt-zinc-cadmium efflux system outer membrane protein
MFRGFNLAVAAGVFALACAGGLLGASGPLSAQEPAADSLLARLTHEAVEANPGLLARRRVARAATVRVRAAGSLPDPMLETGITDLTLPDFAFRESDFTEVNVQLYQEFPWPGTLGARTAQARAEARMRTAEAASRTREVTVRVAQLYYRIRYLVAARATLERQRTLLAAAVEVATARYASTAVPQSDPLQARLALARLEAEANELAAEERGTRARLSAMRDVAPGESLVVAPIRPDSLAAFIEAVHAALMPGADSVADHPRVAARLAQAEAAERQARVEQLGARPDFTIVTRYGARPLGSDFFSAYVGVRLPIWAGRKQHRLAEAAHIEADVARAEAQDERAALRAELDMALADVAAGIRRLELLTGRVVPAARATVEATVRNYRVGQVEFVTVLAAEDALYRAQLDEARVAAEHLTHLVTVQQLVRGEEP